MRFTYLGHAAFRFETGHSVMLVDPFITGNPAAKLSVEEASKGATHVLLTHGHDDHVGDALQILKSSKATMVSNFEICMWLAAQGVENYSPGIHGGCVSFADFELVFTNAWHSSSTVVDGRPLYLGNPMGFVILPKVKGAKPVYLMGDTGLSLDMKLVHELYKPQTGIVPIGDRFTMGAEQAAYACRNFFKFKSVIPSHYASFEGYVAPDAKAFLKAMGPDAKKVRVMASGDSIEI